MVDSWESCNCRLWDSPLLHEEHVPLPSLHALPLDADVPVVHRDGHREGGVEPLAVPRRGQPTS